MARVCVDSNYFDVNDDGQLTIIPGALGFQAVWENLTPGPSVDFVIADYPLAKWLYVEAVGGGGGSAGAFTFPIARGGGSGGTYCASWIDATTLTALTSTVCGAGGTAGASTNGDGGPGGTSSFGAFVVAPGGGGSYVNNASGTPPLIEPWGVASALGTGQIQRRGQTGGLGFTFGVNPDIAAIAGAGGISGWGGMPGGQNAYFATGLAGQPNTGCGASGARAILGSQNCPGAVGGSGFVRVTVYR